MTDADPQDVAESLDDDQIDRDPSPAGGDDLAGLDVSYPPDEPVGVEDVLTGEEDPSLEDRATGRAWRERREREGRTIQPAGDDLFDDTEAQLVASEWDETDADDAAAEEQALHETAPPPYREADSYDDGAPT